MRGATARRIRKEILDDYFIRYRKYNYLRNSPKRSLGAVINIPGSPRVLYQQAKKDYYNARNIKN